MSQPWGLDADHIRPHTVFILFVQSTYLVLASWVVSGFFLRYNMTYGTPWIKLKDLKPLFCPLPSNWWQYSVFSITFRPCLSNSPFTLLLGRSHSFSIIVVQWQQCFCVCVCARNGPSVSMFFWARLCYRDMIGSTPACLVLPTKPKWTTTPL